MEKGTVYLVGAGPGDPKLITLRGLECIQMADVIIYDRLVNPELLNHAGKNAELVYCGKLPNDHTLRQEEINQLLVTKSMEGKIVTRLKGGDPSVFGRVGEEAAELAKRGIPFEIVPGITSGIAAAAYAGIPVTHRDYASSFAVVTGHSRSDIADDRINWQALATGVDTIAFYMGVSNLSHICDQLIKHGRDRLTPAALIQWGTTLKQRTLVGTLENIHEEAQKQQFSHPAIILVGEVVKLRDELQWFEKRQQITTKQFKTNSGSTVLVTGGARSGKSAFAEHLAGRLGAESGRPIVYIATAQIYDDEMAGRIDGHRNRRPPEWRTLESPYDLEDTVKGLYAESVGAVIIDCATMWVSNLLLAPGPMGEKQREEQWMKPEASDLIIQRAAALARLLKKAPFPSVLVTNEVGHALVPEYPLGRVYRDLAGKVNQILANHADDVFYVVCGIPINLRQMAWRPNGGATVS